MPVKAYLAWPDGSTRRLCASCAWDASVLGANGYRVSPFVLIALAERDRSQTPVVRRLDEHGHTPASAGVPTDELVERLYRFGDWRDAASEIHALCDMKDEYLLNVAGYLVRHAELLHWHERYGLESDVDVSALPDTGQASIGAWLESRPLWLGIAAELARRGCIVNDQPRTLALAAAGLLRVVNDEIGTLAARLMWDGQTQLFGPHPAAPDDSMSV